MAQLLCHFLDFPSNLNQISDILFFSHKTHYPHIIFLHFPNRLRSTRERGCVFAYCCYYSPQTQHLHLLNEYTCNMITVKIKNNLCKAPSMGQYKVGVQKMIALIIMYPEKAIVKAASISEPDCPEPVNSACCLVSQHLFPQSLT